MSEKQIPIQKVEDIRKKFMYLVVLGMLNLLTLVMAMSIDQNCTMVIEFQDNRPPVTIPTDQISKIIFQPTFPTPAETPGKHQPVAIFPPVLRA